MNNNPESRIIKKLLEGIEEEDIAISLFNTFYRSAEELAFFGEEDRRRVLEILQTLSDDSRNHKTLLSEIISILGSK